MIREKHLPVVPGALQAGDARHFKMQIRRYREQIHFRIAIFALEGKVCSALCTRTALGTLP